MLKINKSEIKFKYFAIIKYINIFRLAGVLIHTGHYHYIASCKRNNRWELYNDLENDVPTFNVKREIIPHAVIYIKIKQLVYYLYILKTSKWELRAFKSQKNFKLFEKN